MLVNVCCALHVPLAPGDGALVLRIQDDARLTGAQRDEVNSAVADMHSDLLSEFGVMCCSVGGPLPEGPRRLIEMCVKVRSDYPSPGSMDWQPDSHCHHCKGTSRLGFGGRLPCPKCHDGSTSFRLGVGACTVVVHVDYDSSPRVWRVRMLAPAPLGVDTGKWLGWLACEDFFIADSAENWPSADAALKHGEVMAEELERLQAEAA